MQWTWSNWQRILMQWASDNQAIGMRKREQTKRDRHGATVIRQRVRSNGHGAMGMRKTTWGNGDEENSMGNKHVANVNEPRATSMEYGQKAIDIRKWLLNNQHGAMTNSVQKY